MNHKLITLENLKKFKEKIYNYIDRTVTPIGTIIPYLGLVPPPGYLICDGSAFSKTEYPELYKFLGSSLLPDLREISFVGNGKNNTYPIENHYVSNYYNGFSDDQIQNITGNFTAQVGSEGSNTQRADGVFYRNGDRSYLDSNSSSSDYPNGVGFDASRVARTGTITHGKILGVNYIINATAKCPDSQWIVDVTTTIDAGYSRVGDFFLSDEIRIDRTWKQTLKEYDYLPVTITYADENTKQATFKTRTLSMAELITIPITERIGYFNSGITKGWYWTSTLDSSSYAWCVTAAGGIAKYGVDTSNIGGGIRLGCRINGL